MTSERLKRIASEQIAVEKLNEKLSRALYVVTALFVVTLVVTFGLVIAGNYITKDTYVQENKDNYARSSSLVGGNGLPLATASASFPVNTSDIPFLPYNEVLLLKSLMIPLGGAGEEGVAYFEVGGVEWSKAAADGEANQVTIVSSSGTQRLVFASASGSTATFTGIDGETREISLINEASGSKRDPWCSCPTVNCCSSAQHCVTGAYCGDAAGEISCGPYCCCAGMKCVGSWSGTQYRQQCVAE